MDEEAKFEVCPAGYMGEWPSISCVLSVPDLRFVSLIPGGFGDELTVWLQSTAMCVFICVGLWV